MNGSRSLLLAGAGFMVASAAWSHGYVSNPPSRSLLCKEGGNSGCGAVQYEPQSLEYTSGWPNGGPADGKIASANNASFGNLDEQTSTRWNKTSVKAGVTPITWTFTANHATRNFRYYITRADWNPNVKLSRASFESTPFCTHDGGGKQPPKVLTHNCSLPARSGYQIILAVWEVSDTVNSFYNTLDIVYDGNPPPVTWAAKGTIYPSVDLSAGDKVSTRVFGAAGELAQYKTQISIANANDGLRNNWAYNLASRINAEQTVLRAGQKAADGSISPAYGQNEVYVRSDSGLERVEIQVDKAPAGNVDLLVSGLSSEYTIPASGPLSISLNVTAVGELDVAATLLDAAGTNKGQATAALNNSGQTLVVPVNQPAAGTYSMVVKGTPRAGGTVLQKTYAVTLKAGGGTSPSYDYVFPNGLASYRGGTKVLASNGKVYECKPFPYEGWCRVWSSSNNAYEPGVGANWQDAWIAR